MQVDNRIYTSKLELKLFKVEQAQELALLIQTSPSLHQWIDWCHAEFSVHDAEEFIRATRLNWVKGRALGFAIFTRDTQQFVGMVAINEFYSTFNMASLGYWVADKFQGRGIAREALDALVSFCFEQLALTRLEIVCDPSNIASNKLALAIGAEFECEARNRFIYDGIPKIGRVYSIV